MKGKSNPAYRHGMRHTRLYNILRNMKARCSKPKEKDAKVYRDRGITVCKEWIADPKTFFDWAKDNGYTEDLQIDRIDNDKGYSPENCRWVTSAENNRNRSSTKLSLEKVRQIRENKEGMTREQMCSKYSITKSTVSKIVLNKIWKEGGE